MPETTLIQRILFIVKISPLIQAEAQRTGLSAENMLAQAAMETGWGAKGQFINGNTNNLFGMTVSPNSSWTGETYVTPDGIVFRKYDSLEQSIADRTNTLQTSSFYAGIWDPNTLGDARREVFAMEAWDPPTLADPRLYSERMNSMLGAPTDNNSLHQGMKFEEAFGDYIRNPNSEYGWLGRGGDSSAIDTPLPDGVSVSIEPGSGLSYLFVPGDLSGGEPPTLVKVPNEGEGEGTTVGIGHAGLLEGHFESGTLISAGRQ